MTDEGFCGPAIDRLAAYEDTGLEPEEIKDLQLEVAALKTIEAMYDGLGRPDHLRELVEAEKAGRLVVLPSEGGEDAALCVITHDEGDVVNAEVWRVGATDNLMALLSCMVDEVAKAIGVSYARLLRTMLRVPSVNEAALEVRKEERQWQ